tara:strand:- start:6518 stop:6709 length:192 start_codon:yes stop_codon:yes gene_type:complete
MKNQEINRIEKVLSDFYGNEFTEGTKEHRSELIDDFKRAEVETNKQIQEHGGIENWCAEIECL